MAVESCLFAPLARRNSIPAPLAPEIGLNRGRGLAKCEAAAGGDTLAIDACLRKSQSLRRLQPRFSALALPKLYGRRFNERNRQGCCAKPQRRRMRFWINPKTN
jgi:hypothetical protein